MKKINKFVEAIKELVSGIPIKRAKLELNIDEKYYPECAICGRRIEKGEEVVFIPTSSWYANWKSYFIAHEECFLSEMSKIFKDMVGLKKKAKKKIVMRGLE